MVMVCSSIQMVPSMKDPRSSIYEAALVLTLTPMVTPTKGSGQRGVDTAREYKRTKQPVRVTMGDGFKEKCTMKANSFAQATDMWVILKRRYVFVSGCEHFGKYVWKEKEILSEHEEDAPEIVILPMWEGKEICSLTDKQ